MAYRDEKNLGDVISNIVEDACSSKSFERLNRSIRDTIDAVFDELDIENGGEHRTSYGAGDWAAGSRDGKYGYGKASEQWSGKRPGAYGSGAKRPVYERKSWESGGTASSGRREEAEEADPRFAKVPGEQIFSWIHTAAGGWFTGIFGIAAIACLAGLPGDFSAVGVAATLIVTGAAAASALWLKKGLDGRGRVKRFRTYIRTLGNRNYCSIKELAAAVNKPEEFVVKDLRKMLEKGYFPKGRLDMQETTLMLDDETYQQYLNANQAFEARRAEEEKKAGEKKKESIFLTGRESEELKQAVLEGEKYIRQIREANDDIPGEEITRKLDRLEQLMRKIFLVLTQKPDQLPKLRRFMNYYMPTTDKLVQTYRELDKQPVDGENIQKAKKEIEETLDTINDAYEKLLDNFFEEAAMDVSTDISVLQNLMAQEGLTTEPFGEIR